MKSKNADLSYPHDMEISFHKNPAEEFEIQDLLIRPKENSKRVYLDENVASLSQALALINNAGEIPHDWPEMIIFPGTILKRDNDFFMPVLISDAGFSDAVALSNRNAEWSLYFQKIDSSLHGKHYAIIKNRS